jgi:alpha-glucan, water dikinase
MTEVIITERKDLWLGAEKKLADARLEVTLRLKSSANYVLHWGFSRRCPGTWQLPPERIWPAQTRAFSGQAAQTSFTAENGEQRIMLRLDEKSPTPFLVFDLFCPETRHWENNGGKDFYLPLPEFKSDAPSPAQILDQEIKNSEVLHRQVLPLDSAEELAVTVTRDGSDFQVVLLTDAAGPLLLHWGVTDRARSQWRQPAPEIRPPGTTVFDATAAHTPFEDFQQLRRLKLIFREADAPAGISFVLHQPATKQWLKHRAQNIFVPVAPRQPAAGELSALAGQIVEGEMGQHGWTLMHRFTLCHELIDQVRDSRDGWATLFVWLRFSAIRQLDWQRNFNTKPKELSHSQDRLTLKLASLWRQQPGNRDLIRLALAGVGRGGDGQRIRDEILQIMHRHHLKEVGGTWMEQWHQKLHNNTTPDDIVICEAYLAFLYNNGDLNRYYETLAAGGVTKERLAHFDRPITNQPEWHPHLRDALLHDFGNYLKLLKSVHSATDLETAANSAGHLLDGAARDSLNFVRDQFRNPAASVTDITAGIGAVRKNVAARLEHEGDAGSVRELLCLDLALEDILRVVIERSIHSGFSGEQLFELIHRVFENLRLFSDNAELAQCHREWQRLPQQNRFSPDWALHAKAALDRLGRAIANGIDRSYQELQPKAEQLGQAFHADEWAVKLFSEEVVRGQPAFVLSLLIRHLDPILRKSAKLGDWQIISPSAACGQIEAVESLREIQGRRFEQPTIIVAEKVYGDEEPPEGVRAVITPSSVDLVSHVAVRARNASLLFATCYDRPSFDRLRGMKDKIIELKVNAAGDVLFAESLGSAPKTSVVQTAAPTLKNIARAKPTLQPIRLKDFAKGAVGGKSFHLKTLAEKLPDWIRTPRSIALPFGVFDAVLADKANETIATTYTELVTQIQGKQPNTRTALSSPSPPSKERAGVRRPTVSSSDPLTPTLSPLRRGEGEEFVGQTPALPGSKVEALLTEIRQCILELELPENLRGEIQRVMQAEGLPAPADWNVAATRIKQVWASQWNDRAYFSRQARGFPHDAVQMAVLIQEVVEAEYAFVLHTVNPINGNRDELYAEIVRGLGDTLVGNYPGRAMSFVYAKAARRATVLAYPGKSIGLFGGGLIFRSDSNAEDLAGYAGAGLYDSVLLHPPREETLDYTGDKLVWDENFRAEFAGKIAELASAVENAFGGPQDIEGAFVGGKFFVVQSRPQVGL